MAATETEINYSPRNRKFRKILLIIAPVLIILTIILFIIPIMIPGPIIGFLIIFICIDVFTLFLVTKKYYNWGLAFLFLIVTAIFFKSMRWPITGILLTTGFTGLSLVSLYYASKFLSNYKHIPFLRYIGFSSSIILSIVAMGLLWKNMHWPLAGMILNAGLGLFIPFLFAFVFTLPGSNYINWNGTDRAVFFRAIIIPMIFVFTLCVLMLVLPELWTAITRQPMTPFYMWDFELLNKPGIH